MNCAATYGRLGTNKSLYLSQGKVLPLPIHAHGGWCGRRGLVCWGLLALSDLIVISSKPDSPDLGIRRDYRGGLLGYGG